MLHVAMSETLLVLVATVLQNFSGLSRPPEMTSCPKRRLAMATPQTATARSLSVGVDVEKTS